MATSAAATAALPSKLSANRAGAAQCHAVTQIAMLHAITLTSTLAMSVSCRFTSEKEIGSGSVSGASWASMREYA